MARAAEPVVIDVHDLRALLFWATFGVRHAAGGQYSGDIESIITNHARASRFKLDQPPVFAADLKG
jgi:hypothetical protein